MLPQDNKPMDLFQQTAQLQNGQMRQVAQMQREIDVVKSKIKSLRLSEQKTTDRGHSSFIEKGYNTPNSQVPTSGYNSIKNSRPYFFGDTRSYGSAQSENPYLSLAKFPLEVVTNNTMYSIQQRLGSIKKSEQYIDINSLNSASNGFEAPQMNQIYFAKRDSQDPTSAFRSKKDLKQYNTQQDYEGVCVKMNQDTKVKKIKGHFTMRQPSPQPLYTQELKDYDQATRIKVSKLESDNQQFRIQKDIYKQKVSELTMINEHLLKSQINVSPAISDIPNSSVNSQTKPNSPYKNSNHLTEAEYLRQDLKQLENQMNCLQERNKELESIISNKIETPNKSRKNDTDQITNLKLELARFKTQSQKLNLENNKKKDDQMKLLALLQYYENNNREIREENKLLREIVQAQSEPYDTYLQEIIESVL